LRFEFGELGFYLPGVVNAWFHAFLFQKLPLDYKTTPARALCKANGNIH